VVELAVTAIGEDQPGIVATVAEVLLERGGNIEDLAVTILRGRFAMVLFVDGDDEPADLEGALGAATSDLDVVITVVAAGPALEDAQATHVLTVYGTDRPGILAGVTRVLADLHVNITDLATQWLPPEDRPVYAIVIDVSLPGGTSAAEVEAALAEVAEDLGVDHTLRPNTAETY
jgi:glycine cleavage system transcriptional repressor